MYKLYFVQQSKLLDFPMDESAAISQESTVAAPDATHRVSIRSIGRISSTLLVLLLVLLVLLLVLLVLLVYKLYFVHMKLL